MTKSEILDRILELGLQLEVSSILHLEDRERTRLALSFAYSLLARIGEGEEYDPSFLQLVGEVG